MVADYYNMPDAFIRCNIMYFEGNSLSLNLYYSTLVGHVDVLSIHTGAFFSGKQSGNHGDVPYMVVG